MLVNDIYQMGPSEGPEIIRKFIESPDGKIWWRFGKTESLEVMRQRRDTCFPKGTVVVWVGRQPSSGIRRIY